jgi:hypothetical protein
MLSREYEQCGAMKMLLDLLIYGIRLSDIDWFDGGLYIYI